MTRRGTQSDLRGFTLVELLVVIGVIVLLVGFTVAVLPQVADGANRRQTDATLELLAVALEEWERAGDRRVGYGADFAYEINIADPDLQEESAQFARLLELLFRHRPAGDILRRIDGDAYVLDDSAEPPKPIGFRDAWGNQIRAVFPGRKWASGDTGAPDADGTIRLDRETELGVAAGQRIAFVSAGPDGRFGHLHLLVASGSLTDAQRQDVEAAADNVSSYELLEPRP